MTSHVTLGFVNRGRYMLQKYLQNIILDIHTKTMHEC